jgi:hypothetical protein
MMEAKRVQVSLHLEEPLREELEAAARRSVRSLSGEITFRLKRSLECDRGSTATLRLDASEPQ